jgi:LmbE family N-acetylglucosaminyl deacetylase
MLEVVLGDEPTRPLEVLCVGAHSDDIEIGSGGTVLRLLSERPGTRVRWVVLSATDEREREARASAEAFLQEAAEVTVTVERFRESYFPYLGAAIKDFFNELRTGVEPDLVFCPHRHDEHQDHRVVAELVWNTFRNHLIAEYEIPKYEGDLGQPNLFVRLPRAIADRKLALLHEHFPSQLGKYWFRGETFSGIMALRGVEAGSELAEAFHVRKLVT